jgi:hypothetical protein
MDHLLFLYSFSVIKTAKVAIEKDSLSFQEIGSPPRFAQFVSESGPFEVLGLRPPLCYLLMCDRVRVLITTYCVVSKMLKLKISEGENFKQTRKERRGIEKSGRYLID